MTWNWIKNEDCIEGMKSIPDNSVDLVLTDPPFGIDFGKGKKAYGRDESQVLGGYVEIPKEDYPIFTHSWIYEASRVLKEDGSIYIFSGWDNQGVIDAALPFYNLTLINHIIWKYNFGVYCKNKFVTSHYHIFYACKNPKKRKFYGTNDYADMQDVWDIKREFWKGVKTPTKLPKEIVKKILRYSSSEGDIVLDPFMGSGTTAVCAKEMGRNYCGYELSNEIYDFAVKRVEGKWEDCSPTKN